ncbi:RHS repeat-associated core domain-containing protein [Pseudomonas fulva]|uniref:RHS repeat-associated core domain-containing protein n=1 Tax=Pseudomonas fulva TaxID=47880 RepID=UPI0018ABD093|nr:hypothetical protein [Pseudomonas fulva]
MFSKFPSQRILQGFNGEFIELQLGAYLLDLEYRMYTPALMRFQSPDNLSPFRRGGGINFYA